MRIVLWTHQARSDLAAIRAFISQDSPHYASVVVAQIIAATDRLIAFPESGRPVPEFDNPLVRAELVFFETPSGGAVFATGSIAWAASLCHLHYGNNVAQITHNVVRRFLDPTPFAVPK